MAHALFQKIKQFLWKLIRLNSSPRQIALGVAVGVFIGISPFYGMHTLLALLAVMFIPGVNKAAILAGTNVSFFPLGPLITWAGYTLGRVILGNPQYPALKWAMFKSFNMRDITFLYYPYFLGSMILGLILSFIFFFLVLFFIKRMRRSGRIFSGCFLV